LNQHFFYAHQHKRPYITLKFAQSNDGYIGVRHQEIAISNAAAKRYTHLLRSQHQSILVGKNTVLSDNPQLTIRYGNGKNPTRIIIGKASDFPNDFTIFNSDASTIFLLNEEKNNITIDEIGELLYHQNIISVLVEGGRATLQQFIDAGFWNKAHVITSNENINTMYATSERIKTPTLIGSIINKIELENNFVTIYKNPDDIFIA